MRGCARAMAAVWLSALLSIFTGCDSCSCVPPPYPPLDCEFDPPSANLIQEPVRFCWDNDVYQRRSGRVQILIDGSGSMVGFRATTPNILQWLRHTVSHLQGSSLQIDLTRRGPDFEGLRVCQFSQQAGIDCQISVDDLQAYETRGDTNLHEAIASSSDYELTFIVTDGVAATGPGGGGDCATGVDDKCVGRTLRDAIHAQLERGEGSDGGMWIVPITTIYDGKFFTEELLLPHEFERETTLDRIHEDHPEVDVAIQDPHRGHDGRLVFRRYRGPRSMIIIVLARWSTVGRAAVQALWDEAQLQGIERFDSPNSAFSRIATFPPFEAYPGFLNRVKWEDLHSTDTRGTIDWELRDGRAIRLACPEASGQGRFRLSGSLDTRDRSSGCVDVNVLPGVRFDLQPERPQDRDAFDHMLSGFDLVEGSASAIEVCLSCGEAIGRTCEDPILFQWLAGMNYRMAADCLANDRCKVPAYEALGALSTASLSRQPHRILALDTTLEWFYRQIENDQIEVPLSNLEICRE